MRVASGNGDEDEGLRSEEEGQVRRVTDRCAEDMRRSLSCVLRTLRFTAR